MLADQFRHIDTNRPDGAYVKFRRVLTEDEHFSPDDWQPSLRREAKRKLKSGEWVAYGVQAAADIMVIRNKVGTTHTITSAGLWGVVVSGTDDPYLIDVYSDELDALRDDLKAFATLTELP